MDWWHVAYEHRPMANKRPCSAMCRSRPRGQHPDPGYQNRILHSVAPRAGASTWLASETLFHTTQTVGTNGVERFDHHGSSCMPSQSKRTLFCSHVCLGFIPLRVNSHWPQFDIFFSHVPGIRPRVIAVPVGPLYTVKVYRSTDVQHTWLRGSSSAVSRHVGT